MQSPLHQNAGTAQLYGFADLLEDCLARQHVSFAVPHWPVERAKAAIFCAEIRVVDVAIDDVADDTFRMNLPPNAICLHADSDQIIASEEISCLFTRHHHHSPIVSSLSASIRRRGRFGVQSGKRKERFQSLQFVGTYFVADISRHIFVCECGRYST